MSLQTRLGDLITAIGADVKALAASRATNIAGGLEKVGVPSLSSGVLTIDMNTGNYQVIVPAGNVTSWSWQNITGATNTGVCITLFISMSTLRTISTSVAGSGNTVHWMTPQPVHAASKTTVYNIVTLNNGADMFVWAGVEQ